jgi:hypothetical protein
MKVNKFQLLLFLLAILGVVYVFNILSLNKVSSLLADNPVKFSFTVIVPDASQCPKCFDALAMISSIGALQNIEISNKKVITQSNRKFEKLIKDYKIKNLPALVVSGDVLDKRIAGLWESIGGEEESGNIVIQNLAPFYDLAQQKTKGIIEAILLKDSLCEKCFDENQYLQILKRMGMVLGNSTVYDISSSEQGKLLVEKYKIVKVPAMILSPDAADYPWFVSSWGDVGTKETDGWFVLREVQKLGEYKEI